MVRSAASSGLVFAEPAWQLLQPPKEPAAGPQVAVGASKEVEVFVDGRNTFAVQIDRAGFDGPVAVKFENLPAGVEVKPLTIPKGEKKATRPVAASAAATTSSTVNVVAEATRIGKKPTAETSIAVEAHAPGPTVADVFFVLDVTGSMGWAINGVRDGIGRFAADLHHNHIDFRVGLVAFRDLTGSRTRGPG